MAKTVQILGLYLPEKFEEAAEIVEGLDEKQFEKWRREGAVELKVLDVYRVVSTRPAAVLASCTELPEYEPVSEAVVLGSAKIYAEYRVGGKTKSSCELLVDNLLLAGGAAADEKTRLKELLYRLGLGGFIVDLGTVWIELCKRLADVGPVLLGESPLRRTASKILAELAQREDKRGKVEAEAETSLMAMTVRVKIEFEPKFYGWLLLPGNTYILKLQKVRIPVDVMPEPPKFRSSYHRCGWIGVVANIDPGFEGHIYVMLTSTQNAPPLLFEHGARAVQIRLWKLSEKLEGYTGQWQGK